jgi:hypothetical protein
MKQTCFIKLAAAVPSRGGALKQNFFLRVSGGRPRSAGTLSIKKVGRKLSSLARRGMISKKFCFFLREGVKFLNSLVFLKVDREANKRRLILTLSKKSNFPELYLIKY